MELIDELLEMTTKWKYLEVKDLPKFRVMVLLADEFRSLGIPTKFIGKVQIKCSEEFFEYPDKAKQIISNMAQAAANFKEALEEEFGDEALYILEDCMAQFSIEYS